MCGRMTQVRDTREIAEIFGAREVDEDPGERYNVAPTEPITAVVQDGSERSVRLLRWGLLPAWTRDAREGARRINARVETVAETPAFRVAFAQRRCIVPADGFYEWTRTGRAKQPYHIASVDGRPLALAGLWSAWRTPGSGDRVETCAVITTPANGTIAPLHDRMPAILAPDAWDIWLDPASEDRELLRSLLLPAPDPLLRAVPVSRLVNDVANDGPELLRPVDTGRSGAGGREADEGPSVPEPEALTLFG